MKFKFIVLDRGKIRTGFMNAPDLGGARFSLESQKMVIKEIRPVIEPRPVIRFLAWLCVAVGTVAFFWSFFFQATTRKPQNSETKMTIEVRGHFGGSVDRVAEVSVFFPKLPLQIPWKQNSEQPSRSEFVLQRHFYSNRPLPTTLEFRAWDSEGKLLVEKLDVPYHPTNGVHDLGRIEIEPK